MKMKRIIAYISVFTLVLCIGVLPFVPALAESEVSATILFTNDTRGFTDDLTYISRYKENTANAFLLNCGNFSKGSAEASYSNAKYSCQLMKEAGYDLISLGTDDFSYGFRAMKRYSDYAGCQLLSGNVRYSSAEVFEPSIVKEIGGVKIGFFSLTDSACKDYIPSARAEGFTFAEELEFAKEQIGALREKCDKIICLASFFENNKAFTPELLANDLEGLDVLICSGLTEEKNETVGNTLVLAAGEMLASMGKIELLSDGSIAAEILPKTLYDSENKELESVVGTYRSFGQSLVYNTAKETLLEEFEKNLQNPIAKNKTTIYGVLEDVPISLVEETPLGDLFADAMTLAGDKFKATDTALKNHYVVACVNATAIKNNIGSGDITLRDVFDAAEIAEDVYFYEADATLLYELLEKSLSEIEYDSGKDFIYHPSRCFLQISGFNVLVEPAKDTGERIQRLYIINGDDEIDIAKDGTEKFILAVNESLAKGAEGYEQFLDLKPLYVGDFLVNYLRTAIASAVNEEYYISPGTESRISIKRIEELQPNGDAWATLEKTFEAHAACETLVDGIDNMDCSQVDENGEVRITLKTGAHGVSVNGEDSYVSTETGLGIKKDSITPIVDYKLYYKTLDDAYKIDEEAYAKEAVDGYFEYLGRAYVETKLTEEGEVVKATQDIFNVWDDFLENPDSFIKEEEAEDAEEDEDAPYPKLSDFAYKGSFESAVFENTPFTVDSSVSTASATSERETIVSNSSKTPAKTGDIAGVILIIFAISFFVAGSSILAYYIQFKRKGGK